MYILLIFIIKKLLFSFYYIYIIKKLILFSFIYIIYFKFQKSKLSSASYQNNI